MAYFDNAATTFPKPECVYAGVDNFNRNLAMNVGRGNYAENLKAGKIVSDTRKLLLDIFNAENSHKVIFTPSATIALNIILQGLDFKAIKNIYISPFEHNAVLRPLHYLQQKHKFSIIHLSVDKTEMNYDIENITYQFQDHKPDVVIISHASNVCGLIAPLGAIFSLSKTYNAVTIVDMAQTCGLIEVDLKEVSCDCVVFAGHKTLYSTLGVGGFLIKNNMKLTPMLYGGTGVMSALPTQPDTLPEKYEVGSLNTPAIASLYNSLNWIIETKISNLKLKERENYQILYNLLSKYAMIDLIGISNESVGIISCNFKGLSPDNVGDILSKHNIAVRVGLHCSPEAHKFLGTFPAGTVRFSTSYFTSQKDFAELEKVLDYIEENI